MTKASSWKANIKSEIDEETKLLIESSHCGNIKDLLNFCAVLAFVLREDACFSRHFEEIKSEESNGRVVDHSQWADEMEFR